MHRLRRHLRDLAGSPWAPRRRVFGTGEVRWALLSLLGDDPGHGYDLMTRLASRTGGAYKPSAGAVYPALQQLEDEGLVRCEAAEGRKTYAVTSMGRRELQAHADEIASIWARAGDLGEWAELHHPDGAEILGPALRLAKAALKAVIKSRGDESTIEAIRDILDDARAEVERVGRRRRR